MQVCIKCGKTATKVYSPNIDVKGIGMCDEHEEEVKVDLLIANFQGWDKFEKKYSKKQK